MDSTYLMNIEETVGSIAIGKHADVIVLDQNLLDIPKTKIDSTKVLMTVFDGRVVYDVNSSPTSEVAIEKRYDSQLDFSGDHSHPGLVLQTVQVPKTRVDLKTVCDAGYRQ
jgi:hypothetical protein